MNHAQTHPAQGKESEETENESVCQIGMRSLGSCKQVLRISYFL